MRGVRGGARQGVQAGAGDAMSGRAQVEALHRLAALARLRADGAQARLAATNAARARLQQSLAELGAASAPLGVAPAGAEDGAGTPPAPTGAASAPEVGGPVRAAGEAASAAVNATGGAARGAPPPAPDDGGAGQQLAASAPPGAGAGRPLPRPADRAEDGSRPGPAPEFGPAPPPGGVVPMALVRARLAHRVWIERQRAEVLQRLARIEADRLQLLPDAARAHGRAGMLEALARTAANARCRRRARRAEAEGSTADPP